MTGEGRALGAGGRHRAPLAGRQQRHRARLLRRDEVSRENPEWRNGAFTEVLLEGLGKAGDTDATA